MADFVKSLDDGKTDWRGRVVEKKVKVHRVMPKGRPMRWASLHHHSTFSYLDGFGLPLAHAERAAELQISAMALTEHGHVSSHVKLEQAAQVMGVKPLYGCEFYCSPGKTQRKNHLTVLAENAIGYKNLLALNSRAWAENFYYEPTINGQMLKEHKEGLVILSGCLGSQLATSLIGGKLVDEKDASYKRGKAVAARYKAVFGDRYFLECQAFPELEQTCRINGMLAAISEELKIPLVATMDVHYTRPEESLMQQILHNVRGGGRESLEDAARRWGYAVPLCPPSRDMAILRRLIATGLTRKQAEAAVLNTEEIAQQCTVTLPRLPMLRYPLPRGYDKPIEVWRDWIEQGWSYRGFDKLPAADQAACKERLEYEMKIIEDKDFLDYFLVISDAVRWAKDHGIMVGPARGSAAASLVCYLLRIIEVNPILFPNLVFERFIDVTREDLPDIDLDFDSRRRGEVYHYLVGKYGEGRVGNIGTYTVYKSKLALDDVARVYKIPKWEVETIKDLLLERSSGDLRASATIEDTCEQFEAARDVFERHPDLRHAMELEGNLKGQGVHAAGLVVANGPITEVSAIYKRVVAQEEREVIALDKHDAERQGLLKMDFLGLSTISLLNQAVEQLGMTLDEMYQIPLDDEKVIDGFRNNDVVGIFQFDGRSMRTICGSLHPDSFKEICDVNALARPGPLHNGAATEYIDVKRGVKQPEKVHPLLDAITEGTHFQIVYQEQILRIVREIGGFSWTHAAYIRKIISKKLGDAEFNRQWETFLAGALERGVPADVAKRIWGNCITAGSYAFNAAHCVSYGMLAYWTMWLKVYHPTMFYACALSNLAEKKHLDLLRDAAKHGIDILPPDPALSGADWQAEGDALRAGFSQIPGLGAATAARILEYREQRPIQRWSQLGEIKGIGPKTVEKIDEFCSRVDPFDVYRLQQSISRVRKALPEMGLPMPTHTALEVPYERGPDVQVIWLGVVKHRNLRDLFEHNRARTGVELDPKDVTAPHLNEWVIMQGVDDDEILTITIDRFRYPDFREMIWDIKLNSDLVLIKGVKKGFRAARAVYVSDMWVIDPE